MSRSATGTWVDASVQGSRPAVRSTPVHVSALNFWAFVFPAISFIEITIIGRLIVSEILMLAMLPWLWRVPDRLPLPPWFVVLWAGWLLGQIVTDLVVDSAFTDFVRGWAGIAFTMSDFAAILILASTPQRARLFALGLAAGGVLGYLFAPNIYAVGDPWKWAFAMPVGLVIAASLAGPTGFRRPWLMVGVFVAYGALNMLFGFRSIGGVSLLTAGYLTFGAAFGRGPSTSNHSLWRTAVGFAALSLSVVGVLQVYDSAASGGLLGESAQVKYEAQAGTLGVLVGGRSQILVSSQAIIDSPIVGHGSWAKDFEYVDLLADRLSTLGYEAGGGYSDVGLIPAHSYLMGSWVWAGFLGGLFWMGMVGLAMRLLANLHSFRVYLAPLLVFSTMLLLWNIAFSPYGLTSRILASYGVALCLVGLRLVRVDQADDRACSPRLARRGTRSPDRPHSDA